MPVKVPIAPLAMSAYGMATADDEAMRQLLDDLVVRVQGSDNWRGRKRAMHEALSLAGVLADMALQEVDEEEDADEPAGPGDDGPAADGDAADRDAGPPDRMADAADDASLIDADPDDVYANMVSLLLSAVLERLAEAEINCVEQAAWYLLSAADEHSNAAEAWLEADPRHEKAFRRFCRADSDYAEVLELFYGDEEEEENGGRWLH